MEKKNKEKVIVNVLDTSVTVTSSNVLVDTAAVTVVPLTDSVNIYF